MSEEYSDLTFIELVLLEEGLDPKVVYEIERVASKYPPEMQLAFILRYMGGYQSTIAYLLDKHQATISRYLEQLEREVGKLLKIV